MDIKGDWKKRAVCGLMVLAMALSLLPTSILAADTRSVTDNAIKNGSFEQPRNTRPSSATVDSNVDGWQTTATDHEIEFGSSAVGRPPHFESGDLKSADGDQFAELNANEESTLYQYATTVGGNVYEWGLSHRGRSGIDQMALIIGPKQDIDPAKPSRNGKDQFMRMTDWVRQHASEMGVTVYNDTGCTQKITVYSKKFAANGGFQNDIGDSEFSASPSDVYTEKWNVWIIGTRKDAWGHYGTKSSAYAAGNLAYSCRYAVPDGQTKTVFAFCSYSAAGGKTCGNLIDNIHFSLYQTITASATAGGSGFIGVPTGNVSEYYPIGSSMSELVVANGSTIKVKAVKPKDSNVQFVGAYVTRQTAKGLEQVFIPVTDKEWGEEGDTYTYVHPVKEPADIVLVFVKKPMVIYEANGGNRYTYGDNGTNAVSFAQQAGSGGVLTPRGPYTAQAAETTKDGWRFDGWLLPQNNNKVLPAVHTVSYDAESETFTFTANGETTELESVGATLIAQWKWRQRFVTASRVKDENGKVSADFRENTDCGTIKIVDHVGESVANNPAAKDYFASASERVTVTATANAGYEFIGWYQQVDGKKYELVSSEPTHSYTVSREGVQTIYARFAPTHTVKYQWTKTPNECPTEAELIAAGMELPAAATVMDGDNYPISTDYKADETSIPGTKQENGVTVYGKWKFTGWRDENGIIRKVNLVDIRNDRTLTGKWTFTANTKFTLAYQVAEKNSWTPSNLSAPAAEKQYFRTEPVTAASVPTYTPGELYVDQELTLKGTWTFGGWKRNDTKDKDTVAAGGKFNMPGNDVTLTGQWSFTPDTYTVSYDIGNGTGTAPESHDSYDYSALSDKTGCVRASGIPFGASITLQALPDDVQVPKGTYFAGWSLEKPTADNLSTIKTQSPGAEVDDKMLEASEAKDHHVTLYAVYKPVGTATVEFDATPAEGGTVSLLSGSFTVAGSTVTGDDVVSTAAPKAGWHFDGWYEETGSDKTKVIEGLSNDGLTLTVTAKTMADKLGLLPKKVNSNETPAHEVRYVAVFEPNTFTIHYEPHYPIIDAGAQSGEMADQTFSAANTSRNLSPNQFRYKGYTFDGWTTEKGDFYSDGAAFTQTVEHKGKVTLYAKWARLTDVTITYTAYPDSLGSVALNLKREAAVEKDPAVQSEIIYEKVNPETGEIVGATATVNHGSVFAGWYNDLTKKNVETSETFVPLKQNGRYVSASYVAYFRPQRYTLTFDANGGGGEMEPQTFEHGQVLPLNEYRFSRDGYDFVGWALSKDGGKLFDNKAEVRFTALVSSGSELKDGAKATLYAVWHEQSVTLSYEPNDAELGSVSSASETVDAVTGTAKGSTAQPKSGARFDGWYSADGALLSKELTFVPTKKDGAVWQGTTYYAHFSAKRSPSTPSTPAKPDETKPTLAPIPEMLNGEDHYAYLLGYEDGTVRPNGSISRAEVATVLFRLLKDDVRMQNLTKDNAYSDVSDTAWYAAAVSTLSKMGVISGYPDGTFRPNAPITRAEFAAMIARFDETAKSADTPFTDISGHWAENAIGKAYGNGWVEGSSKTVFCPESNLTRAETATLLNRVLHRLPEKESDLLANQIVWPDNPETFWGYLAIQEATNSHEYERKADGVHETQTAKRENRDWSKEFEQ